MAACECARCGRRFTSVRGFERHQTGLNPVQCHDPAGRGMHLNAAGRWSLDGDEAQQRFYASRADPPSPDT